MSQPMQVMMLVVLPYVSIFVFVTGLIWRYRARFTISSLSSQIIESRWLAWGALPFHIGIITLFAGHLLPVVIPGVWQGLVSRHSFLLAVEGIGTSAALLCLAGLIVLFFRRALVPELRPGSTFVDLAILAVLILQAAIGLEVATLHRWGAVWSARTTTPYLWSVLTLQPDATLISGLPFTVQLHITGAWIVLALVPFTRLVHMFAFPAGYLIRPPQKVVWARRARHAE